MIRHNKLLQRPRPNNNTERYCLDSINLDSWCARWWESEAPLAHTNHYTLCVKGHFLLTDQEPWPRKFKGCFPRWRSALVVKRFSPRHGYLRQGMVCWRRWKVNLMFCSSWSSTENKFLVRGFEVAQETWHTENSPSKKCRHVGIHVKKI